MIAYNQIAKTGLLLVLVLFMACSKKSDVSPKPIEEPVINQTDSIGFLALGDSYTIGPGVEESMRWPNQLTKKLKGIGKDVPHTKIIAEVGWTTTMLINAIENNDLNNITDDAVVSLLIGVNNQFQNLPFETFKSEFDLLLNKAIQLAASDRVFVVSIPDYGVTPLGSSNSTQIGQEIDMYNDYISNKCANSNIPFINITEISRDLGGDPNALAPDDLHPSGFQYEKWVEKIFPEVTDLFTE